jgi:hypothetical protein
MARALAMRAILAVLTAAQIHIMSPKSLIDEFPAEHGNIYGTTATFGTPYYGERVKGRVRYGTPKTDHHHCTEQGYDIEDLSGKEEMLRIVMVDRGECTFVTKVRIAQEYKNANGVIVVDNTNMDAKDIAHIIMADDGWGGGERVKIPSILISSAQGEKIKKAIRNGEEVIVELAWDIPTSNVVAIDFWMSSGNREAMKFLSEFKEYVDTLKHQVQFTPHFHIFALPQNLNNLCFDSSGQYCAPAPEGSTSVTGAQVLAEDVRQLCIWEKTKETDPHPPPGQEFLGGTFSPGYWSYIRDFYEFCPINDEVGSNTPSTFGQTCSTRVMEGVRHLDKAVIDQCYNSNAEMYLQKQRENVAWSPLALRINGWRYAGPLDSITVMKAVCSGFITPPPECHEWSRMHYTVIRHRNGVSFSDALMTFGSLVLSLFVIFMCYKRLMTKSVRAALREEVMLEVRSQMADYRQLESDEKR